MNTPQRVQLKRAKGWRKPENTIVVSRPSKWSNPRIPGEWFNGYRSLTECHQLAVDWYRDALAAGSNRLGFTEDDVRRELRGFNLACWCREGLACHGDILLTVANS